MSQSMDYPKFIVSNQKEESISIQRVKLIYRIEHLPFIMQDFS